MRKHVDKAAQAAGWFLVALGFAVVGTFTFTWVGQYLKSTSAETAPSGLALLAGLVVGFSFYALGLFVQVQGPRLEARYQESMPESFQQQLEQALEESFAHFATSGD